jgi:capsular exopolysaccharide synthesis family protein
LTPDTLHRPGGGHTPNLVDYWFILRKRWPLAVVAFISVVVTTVLYDSNRVPLYHASVDILIAPEPLSEQVRTLQPAARKRYSDLNFAYYVEHAKSEGCLGAVMSQGVMGYAPPPRTPEWMNLFEELNRMSEATQVEGRRIVRIGVYDGDPDRVYNIANAFGSAYISSLADDLLYSTQKMEAFIDNEIRQTELEVAQFRSLVAQLESRLGGRASIAIPPGSASTRASAARHLLRQRSFPLAALLRRIQAGQDPPADEMELAITAVLSAIPEDLAQGLGGTARDQLEAGRAVWSDRLQKYRTLAKTMTEHHPERAAARAALLEASVDLIQKIASWARIADMQLAELGALTPSGTWDTAIPGAASLLDTTTADPLALDRYRTEIGIREALLADLVKKRSNLKLERSGREGIAEWIRPAVRPTTAVNEAGNRGLTLGVAFGLLIALAAVFVVESLDSSIKTPRLAELNLGKRVMAVIPCFTDPDARQLEPGPARLVVRTRPSTPESEAYRSLAHKIDVGPQRLIVVTSTGPQEGKSTTCSNLAAALAEMGRRVLLVSANLRRPVLHLIFEVPETPGVGEVILGTVRLKDAIRPTLVERLDMLPSGSRGEAAIASIISSPALGATLRDALESYDFVIVDVPPSAPVSDALSFARIADGVLMVYMVGKASESSVLGVIRSIEDVGGHILGLVMNDAKGVGQSYGYGYNYGEGYYHYEDDRR